MCSLNNQSSDYRSEEQRQAAITAIRDWRCKNQLAVRFTEVALNPYVSGARTMEIYEDEDGYEYWIDPRENRLIQAAPAAGKPSTSYQVGPEKRLPVAELRRIAWEIMGRNIPDFEKRRSSCHPLEDNRNRQVYFFRFDDATQPVPESELPPFVQVGLRADGDLISYTDTLVRPEPEA